MVTVSKRRSRRSSTYFISCFTGLCLFVHGIHVTEDSSFSVYRNGKASGRVLGRVWSTDFHAGPIGCQIKMFDRIRVKVAAEVDFYNCAFFRNSDGRDLCPKSNGGLRNDNWRGVSLYPDPEAQKRKLSIYYGQYAPFKAADVVSCSHPVANCEIYKDMNKSILIYATTRLEFGRNDKFVSWRKQYADSSEERWKKWLSNLIFIARSPYNTIAANNMYDVKYIEYFTGIKPLYMPSWCGGTPEEIRAITYAPRRGEWVLVPYRQNLEYGKSAIPTQGWPEPLNKTHANVLNHEVFAGLKSKSRVSVSDFSLINITEAFHPHGRFTSVEEFRRFKGVVLIPYQSSTMFFFELYRACVPIMVPSKKLLASWTESNRLLWEVSYGNPSTLSKLWGLRLPNPNNFDVHSRKKWLKYYDVYNSKVFPYILYFDSWDKAVELASQYDMQQVSKNMCRHNIREFERISRKWKKVFTRMARRRNTQNFGD